LPFAIGAIILFGMILRARPGITILASLSIVASVIGLAGSLFLFLATVANEKNGQGFLIALLTIVLIFVLVRLQRFIRRFYQRSPAFATLFFALLAIIFVILSNGTTITAIILSQIDYWLALVAFGITLYASVNLTRHSRRLPM
jgi:chromate transport protein ChrA